MHTYTHLHERGTDREALGLEEGEDKPAAQHQLVAAGDEGKRKDAEMGQVVGIDEGWDGGGGAAAANSVS